MKRCPICAKTYQVDQRFCVVHGLPLCEELETGAHEEGDLTGLILDGRYRLAGVVGHGGMGVVYEAENLRIGRRCAVKVLHKELNADPKMRIRLFREVQATSRVQHPNVVEILDFGDDPRAGAYLVMEFLGGRSLSEIVLDSAPLPLPTTLRIASQLASALMACHAGGLIHRDLKPSNVRVLADGNVKVLDFGLVKRFEPDNSGELPTITTGGIAFGTPWYMSPEQASFRPLDPRSDIYSMGVILYELVVGKRPFGGETALDLIDAHRNTPVPLPSTLTPPVMLPPALEMLILRCLSKKPEQRPQSVSDLLDELLRIARQEGLTLADLPLDPRLAAPPAEESPAVPYPEGDATLPMLTTDLPVFDLNQDLLRRIDELGERIAVVERSEIPRYRNLAPEPVAAGARLLLQTALEVFRSPSGELPEEIRRLADQRSEQRFTPAEIIGAMWVELSMMRPLLLEEFASDGQHTVDFLQEQYDRRVLRFIIKLADYYFARYHSRIVEMNQRLSLQNEELNKLRAALSDKLSQASRQLVESEQLKARVIDTIGSGVLLMDWQNHVISIYNRTVEKLIGVPASQAVGRRFEEVLSFVEGVPFEEFMEQLHLHHEVGLRKLWLRLPGGAQKSVYVSAKAFCDVDGEPIYILFVLEDVTEREAVIESFSRYLSRDVVDQVLRRGRALKSSGETRHVVMLEVNIREFRRLRKELPLESVVETLTDYVRVVSEAIFRHGGTIETVMGDSLLVCFPLLRDASRPAVDAAVELCRRMEGVNLKRALRNLPPIVVGVGVHVGDMLVANVGGKRRMVHTLVGDAAQATHALQSAAPGGEILVSSEVAKGLDDSRKLEPCLPLSVGGQAAPLQVFRVPFERTPLAETIP